MDLTNHNLHDYYVENQKLIYRDKQGDKHAGNEQYRWYVQKHLDKRLKDLRLSKDDITLTVRKPNEKKDIESTAFFVHPLRKQPRAYDLLYTDPDGNTYDFINPKTQTSEIYTRERRLKGWDTDKEGKCRKYLSPYGSSQIPYFTGLYKFFKDVKDFDTVYLTEGEFKAYKACQLGVPTIGLTGIWAFAQGIDKEGRTRRECKELNLDFDFEKYRLLPELDQFFRNRTVNNIVLLQDADALRKSDDGSYKRENNFFSSVKTFALTAHITDCIDANLYYAHIQTKYEHDAKGIDDLFQLYADDENETKLIIHNMTKSLGDSEYFKFFNLHETSLLDLQEYFGIPIYNNENPPPPFNDSGNALRFEKAFSHICKYNHTPQRWYIWNGKYWKNDGKNNILNYAHKVVDNIFFNEKSYYEAKIKDNPKDDKGFAQLMKWQIKCGNVKDIKNMLTLAGALPSMSRNMEDFDNKPYLFNLNNGTFSLADMTFREHRLSDQLTKFVHYNYQKDAKCPRWIHFLLTIFNYDMELYYFMQRVIGTALIGRIMYQCLYYCYGYGANGKTLFLRVLDMLFGEYAQNHKAELVEKKDKSEIRNDLARLPGARLVVAGEIPEGKILSDSIIKDLTGQEKITARFLHKEFFEFMPTHTLILYGNHKMRVQGKDHGIWRRINLIPFTTTIPDNRMRDMELMVKEFKDELPGIFNWAVEGLKIQNQIGYGEAYIKKPKSVLLATQEYRKDEDTVLRFVQDILEPVEDKTAKLSTKELHDMYNYWYKEYVGAAYSKPMGIIKFTRNLENHNLEIETGRSRKKLLLGYKVDEGFLSEFNGTMPKTMNDLNDDAGNAYTDFYNKN